MEFFTFFKSDAIRFGVEKAVLLYHIAYWVYMNMANERHYYNGYYWTYNTARAFAKIFPFWSNRKIARMLNDLEVKGIIQSGNFNNVAYDRTKWYTIIDESICHICQMDMSKSSNPFVRNKSPIPDNNQIKTNRSSIQHSNLKQELENHGWVGDFEKLIDSIGSLEAIEYYWTNCLSKLISQVSEDCRGGFLTKRLKANAAEFYERFLLEENKRIQEADRKNQHLEKLRQDEENENMSYKQAIERGKKCWESFSFRERQDVFDETHKRYDFINESFNPETGEITGNIMSNLIYQQLGSEIKVH
ncbi:MAG: hypothetical protein JXR78_12690 [Victivallales bacterium]|nr:hypothetical protein [Victivallales bacterium]